MPIRAVPSRHRRNRHDSCTDEVVGAILSGWRYDISGISPAMRVDYEEHLVECVHCRRRQRIHRTVDLLLLCATTLSFAAFLLAALVIHRLELMTHIGNVHLHLHETALSHVPSSITISLEAVAISVAVMGIAGALLAMVIDRRREFALLRFLGAAQPQVRRIILCEAGLLGLLANVIGLVFGSLLSLILIFVINKQSFGWTLQFHWPAAMLLSSLTLVYLATVLSALYPAHAALRMNPIEVIHEA